MDKILPFQTKGGPSIPADDEQARVPDRLEEQHAKGKPTIYSKSTKVLFKTYSKNTGNKNFPYFQNMVI